MTDVHPDTAVPGRDQFGRRRTIQALAAVAAGSVALTTSGALPASAAPLGSQSVVDAKQFGAVGDGLSDDTDALRAAALHAVDQGMALYIPKGVYRTTRGVDWRVEGLHAFGNGRNQSVLRQDVPTEPVLKLGEQHQHIHDLSLWYARQPSPVEQNANAIELYKSSFSVFERLSAFWCGRGIYIPQVDYRSATDTGVGNFAFSNSWNDIEILGYKISGISHIGYRRSNTGSTWRNIYVRNGPLGPPEVASGNPVVFGGGDEMVIDQLNIEAVVIESGDALLVHGQSATIRGLHLEGVRIRSWDGSFVNAYDVGRTDISAMSIVSCSLASDRGVKSIVKIARGATVSLRGLYLKNNEFPGDTTVLLDAADGTGSFNADGVDGKPFKNLVRNKLVTLPPVAKRINERILYERGVSGQQVASAERPPVAGSAAQGDLVWNSIPKLGAPVGWRCNVSGTPGEWVVM